MYVFVILINIFIIHDVFAQDITQSVAAYKQGKAEILTLEENIKQYKSQLSQIDENIRGLLANKQSIQKELANLNNLINVKKRQISNMSSNIKSTKQKLVIGLNKLKANTDEYNTAKSQIDQLSTVEKSIKDVDKMDKQIRNLNIQLTMANTKAQYVKQINAANDASNNNNIESIKSKLMSLKSSLGVN